MTADVESSSNQTRVERTLAIFTFLFAIVFAPIETAVSWRFGLLSPHYLVDIVLLLFAGALQSIRRRSPSSPALMTVGWAWISANFWRAAMERDFKLKEGDPPDFGLTEVRLAIAMTALAMFCMGIGIWLMHRRDRLTSH